MSDVTQTVVLPDTAVPTQNNSSLSDASTVNVVQGSTPVTTVDVTSGGNTTAPVYTVTTVSPPPSTMDTTVTPVVNSSASTTPSPQPSVVTVDLTQGQPSIGLNGTVPLPPADASPATLSVSTPETVAAAENITTLQTKKLSDVAQDLENAIQDFEDFATNEARYVEQWIVAHADEIRNSALTEFSKIKADKEAAITAIHNLYKDIYTFIGSRLYWVKSKL